MMQALIAVAALLVLAGMSVRANGKFRGERRLPMQWSFAGAVNWTAPRVLALCFTPVLAAIILSATTAGTILSTPRPGQEGFAVPVVALLSLSLVAAHGLHLWLIDRTVRAKRH